MDPAALGRRARARWAALGGKLGLGFAAAGFVLIAVAWNGAAGLDFVQGQVPYLISGGLGGLGLIVLGAAFVITEGNRRDRAELERRLDEVAAGLSRMTIAAPVGGGNGREERVPVPAGAGMVVAGRSSFHTPECHLVAGRDADLVPRERAEAEGLQACRVCQP